MKHLVVDGKITMSNIPTNFTRANGQAFWAAPSGIPVGKLISISKKNINYETFSKKQSNI